MGRNGNLSSEYWYCPACAAIYYEARGGTCHNTYAHLSKPRLKKLKPQDAVDAAHALGGREAVRDMAIAIVKPRLPAPWCSPSHRR